MPTYQPQSSQAGDGAVEDRSSSYENHHPPRVVVGPQDTHDREPLPNMGDRNAAYRNTTRQPPPPPIWAGQYNHYHSHIDSQSRHNQVQRCANCSQDLPYQSRSNSAFSSAPSTADYKKSGSISREPNSNSTSPMFTKGVPTPSDVASPRTPATILSDYSQSDYVAAIPGTMSSRDARPQREARPQTSGNSTKPKMSFARRCKAALKEMFTHRPVDESQLVRIENRHWADEYD